MKPQRGPHRRGQIAGEPGIAQVHHRAGHPPEVPHKQAGVPATSRHHLVSQVRGTGPAHGDPCTQVADQDRHVHADRAAGDTAKPPQPPVGPGGGVFPGTERQIPGRHRAGPSSAPALASPPLPAPPPRWPAPLTVTGGSAASRPTAGFPLPAGPVRRSEQSAGTRPPRRRPRSPRWPLPGSKPSVIRRSGKLGSSVILNTPIARERSLRTVPDGMLRARAISSGVIVMVRDVIRPSGPTTIAR